ncbi:MAG: protein-disulfide reductase DsbD [Chelatococcus sp.]|nr:protein-disulfide reductase DsbD [Chelatococcus sp. YT9]MBS7700077.1 protein-disulfide reductase DsbD [Chelatococcus sp. YT9]MBX3556770.1 protein-disulfide reductase DsbD [Chelatococcus sp.]
MSVLVAALALAHAMMAPASAQNGPVGARPLPADQAFRLSASREADGGLRLTWSIAKGYYLYRDQFDFKTGDTELQPQAILGESQSKEDPTFGVTDIFETRVAILLRPPAATAPDAIAVTYQGCQDGGICYPPATRNIDPATLAISGPARPAATSTADATPLANTAPLAGAWTAPAASRAAARSGISLSGDTSGMVASLLGDGGALMVLASFLLFGMALAFTPCVFPMYPILAGAIARQDEAATWRQGLSLSAVYVVAMAAAFGLLGIAAAWSGQNLQMALQSPVAVGIVAGLFVVLALSMFDLFALQLPSAWINALSRAGTGKRGSLASTAALGFTSALIVGPCVTAPLAGALIYIAQSGDVVLGAAALFALGIGKGIPLILFGTLGQSALPRAGAWMNTVRQAFGFVFLATAIWMASRLVPAEATLALWALLALGLAAWLGAFDTLGADASGRRRAGKTTGLAAALYGILLAIGAASGAGDPLRPLDRLMTQRNGGDTPERTALAFDTAARPDELREHMAANDGKPSLVYVTADWCITCAVIDRGALRDPGIRTQLARFNLIKLDVTDNTAAQQDMMQALQVVGPPTMIFTDPEGREAAGTRLIGEITTATLQAAAAKAETAR